MVLGVLSRIADPSDCPIDAPSEEFIKGCLAFTGLEGLDEDQWYCGRIAFAVRLRRSGHQTPGSQPSRDSAAAMIQAPTWTSSLRPECASALPRQYYWPCYTDSWRNGLTDSDG